MNSPAGGLVLGCVQLGMPYGVANASGKPEYRTALRIVAQAFKGGVRAFDTATAYGDSESVLGRCLAELGIRDKVEVFSKLPPEVDPANPAAVLACARSSIERLGVDTLAGILFHRESALESWDSGGLDSAQALLDNHLASQVGVSCYQPQAAFDALSRPGVDVLQVPANILDRRFAQVCTAALKQGKTLMLRSVFLQGLLLMDPETLPAHMQFAAPRLRAVRTLADSFALPVRLAALLYARAAFPGGRVLVGAETPEQVRENVAVWNMLPVPGLVETVERSFPNEEERLLNPTLWESR
ncbi:MAG: putative Aldo/keto [Desulfovibrionaceae bacterium]|nr:MAG: putative Aldo/keto [Desulfovibrionaceae bacterium]